MFGYDPLWLNHTKKCQISSLNKNKNKTTNTRLFTFMFYVNAVYVKYAFMHFSHPADFPSAVRKSWTSTAVSWWPLCPCSPTPNPTLWQPCWRSSVSRSSNQPIISSVREPSARRCTSFSTASWTWLLKELLGWNFLTAPTSEVQSHSY